MKQKDINLRIKNSDIRMWCDENRQFIKNMVRQIFQLYDMVGWLVRLLEIQLTLYSGEPTHHLTVRVLIISATMFSFIMITQFQRPNWITWMRNIWYYLNASTYISPLPCGVIQFFIGRTKSVKPTETIATTTAIVYW